MKRSVSIVGAGRVGKTLGKRLRALGWRVEAVVTRSPKTARAAVRFIGAGTPIALAGPSIPAPASEAVRAAGVILITTPDRMMERALKELGRARLDWRGKIVLHTSGTLDRSVLGPLARRGAHTGSLHPMQTFSGENIPRLDGVTFTIEGGASAVLVARTIARSLGGVAVKIEGRNKPAYHATAVLASGSSFALIEAALIVLIRIGFTRKRAQQTLLPLIRQMLDNVERLGPRAAWTGPLSRGDYAVVAKHARALRAYPPEFPAAYAAMARLAGRVLAKDPRAVRKQIERAVQISRRKQT